MREKISIMTEIEWQSSFCCQREEAKDSLIKQVPMGSSLSAIWVDCLAAGQRLVLAKASKITP